MVSARKEKLHIKNTIMLALQRDGEAKKDVLKSSLKLETGFTDKVINEIIDDLINVGVIVDDNGTLTLTNKGKELKVQE